MHPHHLTQAREQLRQQVGPATANRYFTSFSVVRTVAQREWGWLAANPVHEVPKLPEPRGRVRFLSEEEGERLLEACQQSVMPYLALLVILALSTGARRGELLKLTWPDVDFSRQRLTFYHTKNRTPRSVPLGHYALVVIQQWQHHKGLCTAKCSLVGDRQAWIATKPGRQHYAVPILPISAFTTCGIPVRPIWR